MGIDFAKEQSKTEILLDATPLSLTKILTYTEPDQDDAVDYSDVYAGMWFANTFEPVLCFNTTAKQWFFYDGVKWCPDDERRAEALAGIFASAIWGYFMQGDDQERKFAGRIQRNKSRRDLLDDAKTFLAVPASKFDAHPELLNCKCGTFNLDTMTWEGHYWKNYLTKCANVTERMDKYKPEYYIDWLTFLGQIQTKGRAKLLQKVFGICLTEDTSEEKFYICHGPTTRNGKSSLLDAVCNMLGTYAITVNPETFATSSGRNGSGPSPDRANMRAARLLHVSEFSKGLLLDCAYVKRITGGDLIKARKLHQDEVTFRLTGQIIINTNYLPQVNDVTIFDSRRVVVIPFTRHFKPEEQDHHLKRKLNSQKMLNQIFYWCLDGLKIYRKEGHLTFPKSVIKATQEYQSDSDKVARFMSECTEEYQNHNLAGSEAYENYTAWCSANGLQTEGKKTFFVELRRKGLLAESGTIDGKTVRNVIRNRVLIGKYSTLDF